MNLTRALIRAAFATALLLPFTAGAQTAPTRAGTTITNDVTASFTDANGNTYTNVTASVTVTVGFQAGVDVTGPTTAQEPISSSTGNSFTVTLHNLGNDNDRITLAETHSTGLDIKAYHFDGNTYLNLGDLNVALMAKSLDIGQSHDVKIVYDVAPGLGGKNLTIELTGTSDRDSNAKQPLTININPQADYKNATVTVGGDGANVDRVPNPLPASALYTATFRINNTSNLQETFDIDVVGGALMTVVSVSQTTATIDYDKFVDITVEYRVADATIGSTGTITLTATSTGGSNAAATASLTVTVVKPVLDIAKEAYKQGGTTPIGAAEVYPGDEIWYKITVTNNGSAAADNVTIEDDLPGAVKYVGVTDAASAWNVTGEPTVGQTGKVTATLKAALAQTSSASLWVKVQVR
jgi:uncharacterized repeat protein (TIGR01451 family)